MRKSYDEKRRRRAARGGAGGAARPWKLKTLEMEVDDAATGQRGRNEAALVSERGAGNRKGFWEEGLGVSGSTHTRVFVAVGRGGGGHRAAWLWSVWHGLGALALSVGFGARTLPVPALSPASHLPPPRLHCFNES